jgi:hypothetical protein
MEGRIDKYLDRGYGSCFLKDFRIAKLVQDSLLKFDGDRYRPFAWVVMPKTSFAADAIGRVGAQTVDAFAQVVHGA